MKYFSLSEQGLRDNNEDYCLVELIADGSNLLAIIADGVGGEMAGEVASMVTCRVISDYLGPLRSVGLEQLRMAVVAANNSVIELQKNPRYEHMATVVSACIISPDDNVIHICHVGDTRIYSLGHTNMGLSKLTEDHSLVGRLFDDGMITEDEAMFHPKRNRIDKCIGSRLLDYFTDYLYVTSFPLTDIKKIFLCTDGLYDVVSSDVIRTILVRDSSADVAVSNLVELALKNGSRDNISAVLIDL